LKVHRATSYVAKPAYIKTVIKAKKKRYIYVLGPAQSDTTVELLSNGGKTADVQASRPFKFALFSGL
jgi:hypothetical protein